MKKQEAFFLFLLLILLEAILISSSTTLKKPAFNKDEEDDYEEEEVKEQSRKQSIQNRTPNQSFFQYCDKDHSFTLDYEEWSSCLQLDESVLASNQETLFPSNLFEIFTLIDKDHNMEISVAEYGDFQNLLLQSKGKTGGGGGGEGEEEMGNEKTKKKKDRNPYDIEDIDEDEEVTVRMKDGSIKKLTRQELSLEMAKRTHGMRKTKNENIVKEEKDTLKLKQLADENPGLARMIKLGNNSLEILKNYNHTHMNSKLTRVQTLKDPDLVEKDNEGNPIQDEPDEDAYIIAHKKNIAEGKGLMVR